MGLLRVHTAVGEQPEQVQLSSACAGMLHRVEQHRMREEIAILDHQVNARDVHVHDAPGADIQMPDFTVAHLSFG